jgi:ABC-type dipeptide/oligopeptide/nickel transport system ATPase component
MIFQEPSIALSSVHTVGEQLAMALQASGQLGSRRWFESSRPAAQTRACELLARVELPDAKRVLDLYPHQLSAGMRRRVMIALGVACRPRLLIADEPTTGLDAPIQAQILDLLVRLVHEDGMSMIFITHDLCVVAEVATELVVLSAGQVVEAGPARRCSSSRSMRIRPACSTAFRATAAGQGWPRARHCLHGPRLLGWRHEPAASTRGRHSARARAGALARGAALQVFRAAALGA